MPRGTKSFAWTNSLTAKERMLVVEQAIVLLEGFYVHLPLKRAMYAVDPVQRLRLLRHRLSHIKSDREFHEEMIDIFTAFRDQHTIYYLPTFGNMAAALPFSVEAFVENQKHKYIVTKLKKGFSPPKPGFLPGIEIVSWNGVPIERAVLLSAAQTPGANSEARHALGLARLTQRALAVMPLPDEKWVYVGYRTKPRSNKRDEIRIDWELIPELPDDHEASDDSRSLSLETHSLRRIRKFQFAAPAAEGRLKSRLPDILKAEQLDGFAYIRIYSFDVDDPDALVAEFKRLLGLLPRNGLIVDVRGNGGGRIWAGERLIQILAGARPIEPERLYFINTPLTLQLCERQKSNRGLGPEGAQPWIKSIRRSAETGATFSAGFPYTDPKQCNEEKPYPGPVLVITDALCYSATEFFAAGFQDHGGIVLGVDRTTGGGGANVKDHADLLAYLNGAVDVPLKRLPKNRVGMRVALRRSVRVGREAGSEVEDFGVAPDLLYDMTRDDLLHNNRDLKAHASKVLAELAGKRRTARRREAKR
jgi:peptidase S41-like protein